MTRREIRDSAFKLVFEQLLRDDDIQELYEIAEEIEEILYNSLSVLSSNQVLMGMPFSGFNA